MELHQIFQQALGSVSLMIVAAVSVGASYYTYVCYTETTLFNRVRQVEATRAQEGLPSEVIITPEDLRLNPELVDILGITDLNNNVNVALETNAHLDYIQFQETVVSNHQFLEDVITMVSDLQFWGDVVTFISYYLY